MNHLLSCPHGGAFWDFDEPDAEIGGLCPICRVHGAIDSEHPENHILESGNREDLLDEYSGEMDIDMIKPNCSHDNISYRSDTIVLDVGITMNLGG